MFKVSICTRFQISIVFFFDSRVRHKEIFMLVYECRAVFICVTPPGQTKKRYRPEIWYTHSPHPYLKTRLLFLRKNGPEGRCPQKPAVSHEFSAYFLDCLVIIHVRRAPGRVYSYFNLYTCVCIYLCVYICESRLLAKEKTIQT